MMRGLLLAFVSSALLASFIGSDANAQQNWPGFRNDGSGLLSVESAPTKWSPENGIRWRADIPGYGQSAPVVFEGQIFLTSMDGPWQERCFVHAYRLEDGYHLWTSEQESSTKVENYFRNSRAAPTCVVDENTVITFFPGGDVTALDHMGNKRWGVSLFDRFGDVSNERGTASSLAQNKESVFVLVDHAGPSYLVAINKSDGRIAWKVDRGERVESWASPVIARYNSHEMVVVSSADRVNIYDAANGEELWALDGVAGNHIPSASVVGTSIFVGSTQMYGSTAEPDQVAASNCRIDVSEDQGQLDFEVKWRAERVNSYYSSPLAFAGYVYYVNKSGVLFCIDQDTGERRFAKRIGNPCWASAIGVTTKAGERFVYFVQKNGFTVVLRPGDDYDLIARNQLWDVEEMLAAAKAAERQRKENVVPADEAKPKTGPERALAGLPEKSLHQMFSYGDPTVYAASLVDGNLLIRTGQHLYCIDGESR